MSVITGKDVRFVIKRIMVLLLAALTLICAVSCASSSYKGDTWDGYRKMPFIDFLDAYMEKNVEIKPGANYRICYADNWKDSSHLGETDLEKNEQMRTYFIDLENDNNGEVENYTICFFMGYTPKEHKLTLKGVKVETLEMYGIEAERFMIELMGKI